MVLGDLTVVVKFSQSGNSLASIANLPAVLPTQSFCPHLIVVPFGEMEDLLLLDCEILSAQALFLSLRAT